QPLLASTATDRRQARRRRLGEQGGVAGVCKGRLRGLADDGHEATPPITLVRLAHARSYLRSIGRRSEGPAGPPGVIRWARSRRPRSWSSRHCGAVGRGRKPETIRVVRWSRLRKDHERRVTLGALLVRARAQRMMVTLGAGAVSTCDRQSFPYNIGRRQAAIRCVLLVS